MMVADSQGERSVMKWSEAIHMGKGELIQHIGSDRQAEVRDVLLETRMIVVRYLDADCTEEERMCPSEFTRVKRPVNLNQS